LFICLFQNTEVGIEVKVAPSSVNYPYTSSIPNFFGMKSVYSVFGRRLYKLVGKVLRHDRQIRGISLLINDDFDDDDEVLVMRIMAILRLMIVEFTPDFWEVYMKRKVNFDMGNL